MNKNSITTNNSLATKYPAIAKEWHPTKNGNLKPEYIDYSSHVKAWWVCSKCGNEFQKSVGGRTSVTKKQVGCAFCTGQRRRVGFNDLETLYPGIKQFWCEKENTEIGMKLEECTKRCKFAMLSNDMKLFRNIKNEHKKCAHFLFTCRVFSNSQKGL